MHAWPRQEYYRYFGELDDPYFGITAKADFTSCYMQSKQDGASSPTIGREDGSFDFGVFEYHEDRKLFVEEASREIARVKNASGLCLGEGESRNDLIPNDQKMILYMKQSPRGHYTFLNYQNLFLVRLKSYEHRIDEKHRR